jgi:UDP-N-acetylglucosamine 3-dehydrogenase
LSGAVGVGIVGAGQVGSKLAAEYITVQRRGKINLLKVCDSSIAPLGALLITKETSSITQEMLTQDIHEILDDPDIAIVHIATPSQTHYELAKMALETGKNVLVEKPMTLNSHEAYDLVDVAKEKGLLIEVSHAIRFNRALQVASEMLTGGELGKTFYIKVHWADQNYLPDKDIIFTLGQNSLDILNLLLNAWPKDVSGVGKAYKNSGTHNDVAYIFAEYPNGIFAHIELSWLNPRNVREVTIVGSEGSLIVDCLNQTLAQHYLDTTYEIPVTPTNTIASQIEHFADRVARDDSAVDLTGPRIVETLQAISRSLSEKKLTTVANVKYTDVEEIIQKILKKSSTQDAKTNAS